MKKILTAITSMILCMTMLALAPAQVVAAADSGGKKYISEVRVGMGKTSDEASKELKADGYTILTDDKGEYADLNKDAGAKSVLKKGPRQKVVYLGYKTTNDADKAVTDLAVMNMRGGYSFQDYEKLMDTQMDSRIKPFVDRFIATLSEYRENLSKPEDSINYKRANYYRTLLNKLTDDDTGGKPIGDLLMNKTKYELGDEAYNKLSDSEKKNHCDILTLLMQGNGQAVQLMETELTKSADTKKTTWIERFIDTDLDKLTEKVKEDNPSLTPSEINSELDKKYNDDAKKILEKWSAFTEILDNYDNALDKIDEVIKDSGKDEKDVSDLKKSSSDEDVREVVSNTYKAEADMVKGGKAAEDTIVKDYLEAVKYGDGTLLDFFERDQSEFEDEDTIRELYPIVDALSGGQLAGLDFLSIKDMILMAITDENGFKKAEIKGETATASIYQDVNREIYERGGVALTDDALRAKANAQEPSGTFELSTLGTVLWSCTAAAGVAAIGSAIGWASSSSAAPAAGSAASRVAEHVHEYNRLSNIESSCRSKIDNLELFKKGVDDSLRQKLIDAQAATKKFLSDKGYTSVKDLYDKRSAFVDSTTESSLKSNICKYLAAGFTVVMAVLAAVSIYTTVKEMMDYYKVDFSPIPKYIVEKTDITAINPKGEEVMIKNQTAYYKVVPCNRTEGDSDVEKKNYKVLLDRNDLNGDVGQQWLSLYSVKYENGTPILADSLKLKMGDGDAPEGYSTGIHRFGEATAFNLTHKPYCYNDPNNGTYVYYKTDTVSVKEQTAGSLFSVGSLAIGAVAGLIAGSALALLFAFSVRKRREARIS